MDLLSLTDAELAKASPEDRAAYLALLGSVRKPPPFVDHEFKEQAAFIKDPSRLKVLIATRRAGKSIGLVRYLCKVAWETPNVSCLYIGLTRDSAKKAVWQHGFKALQRDLNLEVVHNETELSVRFPNGSIIYLIGAESSAQVAERLRGGKFPLIVVDEAASFGQSLRDLYFQILKPAVMDYKGTICLSGTPGTIKNGLFWDLTRGQNPGTPGTWTAIDEKTGSKWSGHRWCGLQNPYMAQTFAEEIAGMRANNPHIDEVPSFQREYLGKWAIDDNKLVYRYDPDRNKWDGKLPKYNQGEWHHVLGCDLGFNDPTAWTVIAYHDHDPNTYVRKSYSIGGLDLTAVANEAKKLDKLYNFESWVIDNANKQGVEEMKRRHDVPWIAAEKTGKADFIEIMNAEYIKGTIKVYEEECQNLTQEYAELVWIVKNEGGTNEVVIREENPGCDNHCADSALYGFRRCYGYLSEALAAPAPAMNTNEWHSAIMAGQERDMDQRWQTLMERNRKANEDSLSDDTWDY